MTHSLAGGVIQVTMGVGIHDQEDVLNKNAFLDDEEEDCHSPP